MKRCLVLKGTWNTVCERAYEYARECIDRYRIKQSLRALFYYLADSEGLILHSQRAYKKFSERFARYREKHGVIDIIEDRSRRLLEYYNDYAPDIRDYVKYRLEELIKDLQEYLWKLPKWYLQENYVTIWVEKETITLVELIAKEYEVDAFPTKGFSSITMIWKAVQRMNYVGKKNIILVLTDFDPSGIFIERDYREKIRRYGGKAKIIRVAMLPEQIKKYDIPAIPYDDPRAIRVKRDPRYKSFLKLCKEMDVKPEIVELDAFAGLKPREFRDLIVEHIEKYYDKKVLETVKKIEEERRKEVIKVTNKIKSLLNEL